MRWYSVAVVWNSVDGMRWEFTSRNAHLDVLEEAHRGGSRRDCLKPHLSSFVFFAGRI